MQVGAQWYPGAGVLAAAADATDVNEAAAEDVVNVILESATFWLVAVPEGVENQSS